MKYYRLGDTIPKLNLKGKYPIINKVDKDNIHLSHSGKEAMIISRWFLKEYFDIEVEV